MTNSAITPEKFTRVNSDINGNPGYATHFLNLLNNDESNNYDISVNDKYNIAIKRAKSIGGRKYHTKSYGGGIVFQSYNIQDTCKDINELVNTLQN